MNALLQCLSTEPVPDLLRVAGLLALPLILHFALGRAARRGLDLERPQEPLPFFDGIPSAQSSQVSPGSEATARATDSRGSEGAKVWMKS